MRNNLRIQTDEQIADRISFIPDLLIKTSKAIAKVGMELHVFVLKFS